jgi:hypothetical protein
MAATAGAFPAAAQTAADANARPFASIHGSFWRPIRSDFGPGTAFMILGDAIYVRAPCIGATDVFDGHDGRPHFSFVSDTTARTTADCVARKPAFDAAEKRLRETTVSLRDGNTLTLLDADDREIASLARIVPDGIEYRWWLITGYRRGGKMLRLFEPNARQPEIAFFNGQVQGTAGAGQFDGTYSLKANRMHGTVGMLCAGGCLGDIVERTGPQVNAIIGTLNDNLTPRADGSDRFVLYDRHGQAQLELTEEKLP